MLRRRFRGQSFHGYRKRLLRETEITLTHALIHPEQFPPIPFLEVGKGCFDPVFARRYWENRLEIQVLNPEGKCAEGPA